MAEGLKQSEQFGFPETYWTEQDRITQGILRPETERVLAAHFPPGQPVLLNHKGIDKDPEGFVPSRDFLHHEAQVPNAVLNQVFTKGHFERHPLQQRRLWVPGGELLQLPDDGVDIYSLSPRDAIQYMAEKLSPVYLLNTPSLDSIFPHGFNRHDFKHLLGVAEDALFLADEAAKQRTDITPQTYTMVANIALSHDSGNGIAGRWRHSLAVQPLLKARIPQTANNEAMWLRLLNGDALHDEPILKIFLTQYGGLKPDGKIDIDKAIPIMQEHIRPEGLIILASDKRQDGRDREPVKARHRDALKDDPNDLVVLLLERETPLISPDGTTYTFRLRYNSHIKPTGQFGWAGRPSKRVEYFPTGQRVHLPDDIHKPWRRLGIPHSFSLEKAWIDLYYGHQDRFAAKVASTFALFPRLTEFRLDFYDPFQPDTLDPDYKRQLEDARVFHRGRIEQDIAHYLDVLSTPVMKIVA